MKAVALRVAAKRDIEAAADHYTDEAGEGIARRFASTQSDTFHSVCDRPGTGSPRYGNLLGIDGLRSRKLARFPYLVLYVERIHHIDVWRVLHAQRDIPASLREGDG